MIVGSLAPTEIPTIIDPSATTNYPSATGSIIVGISVPRLTVTRSFKCILTCPVFSSAVCRSNVCRLLWFLMIRWVFPTSNLPKGLLKVCVCRWLRLRMHACACMFAGLCSHVYVPWRYVCSWMSVHTCISYVPARMCSYVDSYTRKRQTCIHTHTDLIHTPTHTCIPYFQLTCTEDLV